MEDGARMAFSVIGLVIGLILLYYAGTGLYFAIAENVLGFNVWKSVIILVISFILIGLGVGGLSSKNN